MSLGDREDALFSKSQAVEPVAPEGGPETTSPARGCQGGGRKGAVIGVVLVLLLTSLGIVLSWAGWGHRKGTVPPTTPVDRILADPRLSYRGPYRNVHPDVGYVGDASCVACHRDETASFREHPMGHSLLPIEQVAPRQYYDKEHHNPFEAVGSRFLVERQGNRVRHRQTRFDERGQPLFDYVVEVHYVIGSGRGGYSYLTDRDGYLFQTAISWFSQKQRWDLSPGFDAGSVTGRPVTSDCLFCHANRARLRDGYRNRYEEPIFDGHVIGCERCHGPGQRHVETTDKWDVINPKKLSPALQDAICEQCHLEGRVRVLPRGRGLYDFRPGLPLEDFWSVFVSETDSGEEREAVTHVEQMHESRCYQGSSGATKLHCASCHNPHHYVRPAQRVAYYRASCLASACHEQHGCALPRPVRLQTSKEDGCVDCHMPHQQAVDVAHTAATDHRIVRRIRHKPASPPLGSGQGWLLSYFGSRRFDAGDSRQGRDLGIALIQAASRSQVPPRRASAQALTMLDRALAEDDTDSDVWEAKGWALLLQNSGASALAAFEKALELEPRREVALTGAAEAAQYVGQADKALAYWRRAVDANPWMPIYRKQLALLLMQKQNWAEVRSQCQAWMRLDPASAEARMLWVTCLARAGDKDKARAEFARLEALQPPKLDEFRALFAKQMASGGR
jgi:tetratricopeptide (TPR) repeat protein